MPEATKRKRRRIDHGRLASMLDILKERGVRSYHEGVDGDVHIEFEPPQMDVAKLAELMEQGTGGREGLPMTDAMRRRIQEERRRTPRATGVDLGADA